MGGGGLLSYSITNNNPYKIKAIYTHKETKQITQSIQSIESNNCNITYNNTKQQHTESTQQNKESKQSHNIHNIQHIESTRKNHNTDSIHSRQQIQDNADKYDNTTQSHTLKPEHIDYIIFLDSDDYWKLNCIETCIKHAEGVDIVWFDAELFYDGMPQRKESESVHALYKHKYNTKITRDEWAQIFMESHHGYFSCVACVLIEFRFFLSLDLYFLEQAIYEDVHFGSLLFLQSKKIFIMQEDCYTYRIRPNSTTTTTIKTKIPHYISHIHSAFQETHITRNYHESSSYFLMFLDFIDFLKRNPKTLTQEMQDRFLKPYIQPSAHLLSFHHDPLHLIPQLYKLEPYLAKKFKLRDSMRIYRPKLYRKLQPLWAGV